MPEAPADNIFSKILSGELPSHRVYENDQVLAFLDIYPQAPGHTLVIPRNYSANLFEAEVEDILACLSAVRLISPAIKQATACGGVSVLTNSGKDAGQMIEYLHWHVIPRFAKDSVSLSQLGPAADHAELAALAERIRGELEGG